MGGWWPTPKDIFKSRWKRFYKRGNRQRSMKINAADWEKPHMQGFRAKNFLAAPWKWNYSTENFPRDGGKPPDLTGTADVMYRNQVKRFMLPLQHLTVMSKETGARNTKEPDVQDFILRCLDAGRRGRCDSGHGRAEVALDKKAVAPSHLLQAMEAASDEDARGETEASSAEFLSAISTFETSPTHFHVRRLMQLCEEWEITWEGGQAEDEDEENEPARGRFPYIDEQASLVDELTLKSILRLRHKTKCRRSPRWLEAVYHMKKGRSSYLRRRAVCTEEANAQMGVLKQAMGQ